MAVLGTKLHLPVPRRELVPRPRLTDVLPTAGSAMPRLVLVSAPAGFGKTTLLSQWLAIGHEHRRPRAHGCRWTRATTTPVASWPISSPRCSAANPEAVANTTALVETGGDVPAEAVLVSLVNDLDQVDGATVLALDDYHVIDEAEVHDAVAFLLEHLPPRATIAMATRADPPLPLARLRARAELVELRASDLRFTPAEADAFLNRVMGLNISADQVAALDARTEGWAAGLQLAGLSMRGHDQTAAFVEAFTGSHRFVLDYLVEEVLGRLARDVREFLLATSVLDRLTGPLCDALTGRTDGHQMLESLDRDNLFVVPLDDQRQWYRYHHLFADALRARLAAEHADRTRGCTAPPLGGTPTTTCWKTPSGTQPPAATPRRRPTSSRRRCPRPVACAATHARWMAGGAARRRGPAAAGARHRSARGCVWSRATSTGSRRGCGTPSVRSRPCPSVNGLRRVRRRRAADVARVDRDLPRVGRPGSRRRGRHRRVRPPRARPGRPRRPLRPRRCRRVPRAGRVGGR